MITIDLPRLFERPPLAVMAFMAGLSAAAGVSARLYVDAMEMMLVERCGGDQE